MSYKSVLTSSAIRRALAPYAPELPMEVYEQVRLYMEILLLWNQRVNLTGISSPLKIVEQHFGESIYALHVMPSLGGRLADVGTGAGFPGLPLKLVRPGIEIVLIEASTKKCSFLSEVVRKLGLKDVQVVNRRFEEVSVSVPVATYIAARAIGRLARLLRWSRGALERDGAVLLWLGTVDALRVSATHGWVWQRPAPIPNSRRRVLLVGHHQV